MKKEVNTGYVKKETSLIVAIIALIIGFFGGVILTIYKSGSVLPVQTAARPQPVGTDQTAPPGNAKNIIELEKRTLKKPDDVDAWIQLGNLHFDSNNYDEAIIAYNKSLELNPDNADVLTDLGVMYRRSGRPNEAVKSFNRAIKVNSRHEISRLNKGVVLMHDLNDVEGAIKAWEELLLLNPMAKTSSGQSVSDLIQKVKKL